MIRRQFSTWAMLCMSWAVWSGSAHAAVSVQQVAPAVSGIDADGKPVSLANYAGKIVVLEWTNHDCPFVKKHYESGNLQRLQQSATQQGVVWLQVISSAPGEQGHVNGATAKQVNTYREAKATGIVLDPSGQIGKQYGAQTTPHLFIIDKQGHVAYKGGIDSIASNRQEDIAQAVPYVANALKELVAGQAVSQASTRPYGCSVKYAR